MVKKEDIKVKKETKTNDIEYIGNKLADIGNVINEVRNEIQLLKLRTETIDRKVQIVAGRMGVE